jgi:protein-S-isoprenylcysteine O-methyltransferase Ste14
VASAALLGFPAYLALLLWALACPGLSRLVWTLGLAAAALAGAGWLLAGARS